jgi:hypothetical protein
MSMSEYLFSGINPAVMRDLKRAYNAVRSFMVEEVEKCKEMVVDAKLREWDSLEADGLLQLIIMEKTLSLEYILARRWAENEARKNKVAWRVLQRLEYHIERAYEVHDQAQIIEQLAYHVKQFFLYAKIMVYMRKEKRGEVPGIGGSANAGTEAPA